MPILPVCRKDAVQEKRGLAVECGGKEIALFQIEGKYYACSNRCPHAGAQLSEGFLSGTVVTCPWHGWSFELEVGEVAPRDGVTRFEVVEDGDELKIVLPD